MPLSDFSRTSAHTSFNAPSIAEVRCDKCNALVRGRSPTKTFNGQTEPQCPSCGITASSSPKKKVKQEDGSFKMVPKWTGPKATGRNIPQAWLPGPKDLKLNPSSRLIGLEIEIDRYNNGIAIDDVVRYFKGANTHDGTAGSGLEINTAPAGGDLFVKNTKELSERIRAAGAKCGTALGGAGLHVHIDASDMQYADIRKVIILYSKLESGIYSIIDPKRATGNYCKPIGSAVQEALRDPSTAKEDVVNLVCDKDWMNRNRGKAYGKQPGGGDRYKGLNVWSWWIHQTIEYRMHHGTTQWQKMIPFGMLLCAIHDTAMRIKEDDMWNFPDELEGLMKMAPDTSLDFRKEGEAMPEPTKGMTWDLDKDGVRIWIKSRWDYFSNGRKLDPILPKMDY